MHGIDLIVTITLALVTIISNLDRIFKYVIDLTNLTYFPILQVEEDIFNSFLIGTTCYVTNSYADAVRHRKTGRVVLISSVREPTYKWVSFRLVKDVGTSKREVPAESGFGSRLISDFTGVKNA